MLVMVNGELQLQQAYQAASQVIAISQTLFASLINAVAN